MQEGRKSKTATLRAVATHGMVVGPTAGLVIGAGAAVLAGAPANEVVACGVIGAYSGMLGGALWEGSRLTRRGPFGEGEKR